MLTRLKTAFVFAVVLMLIGSTVGPVATAGATGGSGGVDVQQDDSIEAADEIYVKDNGDAILVYESTGASQTTSANYGLDVSEGLLHVFVQDNSSPGTDVTGNASFVMGPESLSGDGQFQMPTPDSVTDLTADATLKQTRKDASASASIDATFDTRSSGYGQTAAMYSSVTTQGSLSASASTFTTDGTVEVEFEERPPSLAKQHHEFTLEETDAGYSFSAAQDYEVSQYVRQNYETRDAAKRTLDAQFGSIARQLQGDATVTIDSYSFDAASGRLDIAYSVQFTGVDEALSQQLAQSLVSSPQVSLSADEADEIARRIQKLEVTKVSGTVDVTDTSAKASWDVRFDEYDEVANAMLDVAAATEMQDPQAIEDARKGLEAQQAADLTQTVTWDGSLTSPSETSARIQFDANYETKNWGAFVSELESRGVKNVGETTAEFHARTEDGELKTEFSAEVSQKDLVEQGVDGVLDTVQGRSTDSQAAKALRAFQRSEFERARMDVSVEENSVTFEAGASFDNISAFETVMQDEFGDMNAVSAYGEMEDGSGKTYVRLKGATGENPTESEVRALAGVDAETTIHMPGDWDPEKQSFPEMDTEYVKNYLEVDDSSGGLLGGMPGFGVGAALLGLLGTSLVAMRLRD
ncbi:hypothetical protein [Haloarchaeobius sp. TZWWS8]|uniref:hypothetical protein n=1 Tax=Haloarchaeobius sp. TZWWS8 TaxID=3446121 RepID=UPI003EBEE33A